MSVAALTDDLDALLERLGKRRFMFWSIRPDLHGPEIVAAVFDYGGAADVLILIDEDHAVAYRTPTGEGIDVFAPPRVYWLYHSSPVWTLRALLTLAAPGHPDAPACLHQPPRGLGIPAQNACPYASGGADGPDRPMSPPGPGPHSTEHDQPLEDQAWLAPR